MNRLLAALRGFHTPAWLTGMLRGVAEAAAFAALYAGADALPNVDMPNKGLVLMALPFVLRTAEGVIDHIDPQKVRRRAAADAVTPQT